MNICGIDINPADLKEKYGYPMSYVDIKTHSGYLIYYSGQKGIQVKAGVFTYRYYFRDEGISVSFNPENDNNYILIHENIEPLNICDHGKIMVTNKEDISKGIELIKEYLKERFDELKKEYDDRLNRFKEAIESEVKYDVC